MAERLTAAASPVEAFRAVSLSADPVLQVAVPRLLPHDPRGRVTVLENGADRIVLESDGGGGVLVLRRAFQPLLAAWAGEKRLPTFPANTHLTGIAVPPGRWRIELEAGYAPELGAACVALAALGAALIAGRRGRHPQHRQSAEEAA